MYYLTKFFTMKQYAKEIEKAKAQIEAWKTSGGKAYSVNDLTTKVSRLEKAIAREDAEGAERHAAALGEQFKSIEAQEETVETTVKNSLSKKK